MYIKGSERRPCVRLPTRPRSHGGAARSFGQRERGMGGQIRKDITGKQSKELQKRKESCAVQSVRECTRPIPGKSAVHSFLFCSVWSQVGKVSPSFLRKKGAC